MYLAAYYLYDCGEDNHKLDIVGAFSTEKLAVDALIRCLIKKGCLDVDRFNEYWEDNDENFSPIDQATYCNMLLETIHSFRDLETTCANWDSQGSDSSYEYTWKIAMEYVELDRDTIQ